MNLFAKGFDEADGLTWCVLVVFVGAILIRAFYRLKLLERNPEAYKTLQDEDERKNAKRTAMLMKGAGLLGRFLRK
jgi:hypothetical protein